MIALLLIVDDIKTAKKYLKEKVLEKDDVFFEIEKATKEYSIGDIKNILSQIKIYNPKRRVYFLGDFQNSSLEAQNCFLKALEEPPENILFILTSNSLNRIIPTIASRVSIIRLARKNTLTVSPVVRQDLEMFVKNKNLQILSGKSISGINREDGLKLFSELIVFFRERLKEDKTSAKILKEILAKKRLFENNNLNPQLTIDHILIFIHNCYNGYNGYKSYKK